MFRRLGGALIALTPLVLAGPSGVGKGTLGGMLLRDYPGLFQLSSSHTTRGPRPGEINGVHYWFVSREAFEKGLAEGKFLEYNEFNNNLYGTSVDAVASIQENGKVCLLDIDINGCKALKEKMDARYVFITLPEPQLENLQSRLKGRGTDNDAAIQGRLAIAEKEIAFQKENPEFFAKVIVNDDLQTAYNELKEFLKEDIENYEKKQQN
eukprot:TRINITY_DN11327_c0_g1_i1.p1 TRINITY_DN11327_c0_g1~~TRINITY_DN11327_c0_g1_i1.p1  ORF type:complete len:209 (+),score=60.89 TRINITY_DN11327_c0_g1_i1:46-672(+)